MSHHPLPSSHLYCIFSPPSLLSSFLLSPLSSPLSSSPPSSLSSVLPLLTSLPSSSSSCSWYLRTIGAWCYRCLALNGQTVGKDWPWCKSTERQTHTDWTNCNVTSVFHLHPFHPPTTTITHSHTHTHTHAEHPGWHGHGGRHEDVGLRRD